MKNVRIRSCFTQDVTIIPNDFLDRYLADANGEFVKIYLCLLRMSGRREEAVTLSGIADRMNCTENDILRALRYWEKLGVLTLAYEANEALSGITFGGYCAREAKPQETETDPDVDETEEAAELPSSEEPNYGRSADVTRERLAELGNFEEIRELFFVTQQYFGRPLKRNEMQSIAFFYDSLNFSPSLIDYLIEYCVDHGHKSFRYIEKVALSWKEEGITTVLEAKNQAGSYHKEYYDILKSLGLNNHHPIEAETALMRKWLETYHFPMELISEACTRTVISAAKPSLNYVDGILTKWHERGVNCFEDIKKLDEEHTKRATSAAASAQNTAAKTRNAFNSFEQRSYDYATLEEQLLKRSKDPKPS